ncbi:MAG: RND transporter [Desulfobulbaceae bacterium]|nr:RND transporter [Desulfobulbaceae bacterium]
MALAPFVPQPHLLEKLKMLTAGRLVKPLDIFDLFLHLIPLLLLVAKVVRGVTGKAG